MEGKETKLDALLIIMKKRNFKNPLLIPEKFVPLQADYYPNM